MTSYTERVKASLREELLDTAAGILPDVGYAGLRMADVAAGVGVSRQTVYNEFGSKSALVRAVAMRTAAEFHEGVQARLDAADDLVEGTRAATTYVIEHARADRLVAAALGTEAAEDLVPLITTRGEPILRRSIEQGTAHFASRLPEVDIATCRRLAETVTRLTMSHLVLPTGTAAEAAEAVCSVLAPLLDHCVHGSDLSTEDTK
ncbi:TetR family transcriptional regulator [Amycolatopsis antarctica]|uniref:TetR family transcriptional regulator n=1 Tax=Amycolatopsis antarctica TaxID=1854586 RepID=A0A263CZW2_9PSEU|nr:TetR family transcriptional regulator [Amycolatopsis antarctica]